MATPILHKYLDYGARALSNITLLSGERVFISLQPKGLAVHRLHLGGYIPGRRLFAANAVDRDRICRVLLRDADKLPPLPQAVQQHRDDGAMLEFMDAAIIDLKAVAEFKPVPGAVDAIDTENPPPRPLALLTRLALTLPDAVGLAARLERVRNIPG